MLSMTRTAALFSIAGKKVVFRLVGDEFDAIKDMLPTYKNKLFFTGIVETVTLRNMFVYFEPLNRTIMFPTGSYVIVKYIKMEGFSNKENSGISKSDNKNENGDDDSNDNEEREIKPTYYYTSQFNGLEESKELFHWNGNSID